MCAIRSQRKATRKDQEQMAMVQKYKELDLTYLPGFIQIYVASYEDLKIYTLGTEKLCPALVLLDQNEQDLRMQNSGYQTQSSYPQSKLLLSVCTQ
jgi:hypothetical protein